VTALSSQLLTIILTS